jgi:O-antigen/teichoic acid export membrane protein
MDQTETLVPPPLRSEGFFVNIAWTWAGVVANFIAVLFLSPYVIHKLGAEGYGIWTLIFSFVGYYGFIDFGFRSSLIYFTGYFRAKGEPERVNEVINTVLFYYVSGSLVPLVVGLAIARPAVRWFHISPQFQSDFSLLTVLMVFAWLFGMNVFGACLEGFQRFDLSSRIYVVTLVLRVAGTVAVLATGHGLLALGINYLSVQVIGIGLCWFALRRTFPQLALSSDLVKFSMLKRMASYGVHSFVANIGFQTLSQSAPLVIGVFRPAAFIGYFSLPQRMLQYTTDFVIRMGNVTNSSAVELATQKRRDTLIRLGIFSNRYSFMLFVPLVVFLLVYGGDLIQVWVGSEFALHSTPLLPILAVGVALAIGGQFNTCSMLFSLQKNKEYGRSLLVESALTVAGLLYAIPRYGILGAAWAMVIPMLLVRGLYAAWLFCRTLDYPLGRYLASIYTLPLLIGAAIFVVMNWVKPALISGRNWYELIGAGMLTGAIYLPPAIFACIEAEHRRLIWRTVLGTLQRLTGVRRAEA